MSRSGAAALISAIALTAALASESRAAVIRYDFTGYVQGILLPLPPGTLGSSFTTLSTFEGYIQYDQATAPWYDDGTQAAWDLTSEVETYLTNGIETLSSTQLIQMGVWTYPSDDWSIWSGLHDPPLAPTQWTLVLDFFDGTPDPLGPPPAIPGANLTLANFPSHSATLYVSGAPGYGNPWAIPLRLTTFVGHVVPEPALELAALGALVAAAAARYRSRASR